MSTTPKHPPDGGATARIEERLRRDDARLLAEEVRLAADEAALGTNRFVARLAMAHVGTLAIACAAVTSCPSRSTVTSRRSRRRRPRHDSVGTTALRYHGLTPSRLAVGVVANAYHRPTVPWRLVATAVCATGGSA